MNTRLMAHYGKYGQKAELRQPCVEQCNGCKKQFAPEPPDPDGKTYCETYTNPAAWWESGKICPFMYRPPITKEEKIKNSSKANRGGKRMRRQKAAAQHVADQADRVTRNKK